MLDIQNGSSKLNIPIKTVGIRNLKLPIFIVKKNNNEDQHTVADIDVFVDLAGNQKGIHMSRLPQQLQKQLSTKLSLKKINDIAENIKNISEADRCQIIYKFPYFINKSAPVSEEIGIVYYNVTFDVTNSNGNTSCFVMTIETTATSLCPCSKEISKYGAHNQRSKIKIQCEIKDFEFIYIEDLIEISERNASCPIYSVLKRVDEKFVTEQAYENPKFVEDMVRELFDDLTHTIKDKVNWYKVSVSNEESIHQHDAYCSLSSL